MVQPEPAPSDPSPPSPPSPPPDTATTLNGASSPPLDDATALKIYNRYAQLQAQLTADFQRELGSAFGLAPVTPRNGQGGDGKRGSRDDDDDDDEDEDADDEDDDEEDDQQANLPLPSSQRNRHVGRRPRGLLRPGGRLIPHPPPPPPPMPGSKKNRKGGVKEEEAKRVRASKLEFKRLDELFNKDTYSYYLSETHEDVTGGKEDLYEEYVFVVVRKFGMIPAVTGEVHQKYLKTNVEIKSIPLREAVREVMKDVKAIPLREDKPSVEARLLWNYLPQFEEALEKAQSEAGDAEEGEKKLLVEHLKLLVGYLTTDFASTAKVLYPLLSHGEITYDLLWALFLPNTLVYTTCAGTSEQRIVKVTWAEEKVDQRGKFFKIDCTYIDYDGKNFGYADAVIEIDEFSNAKKITEMHAFPLAYHVDEERIRERLVERGRKWAGMTGQKYRAYNGIAFYKSKKGLVRMSTKGRIMVDPLTFRRINANYPHTLVAKGGRITGGGGGGGCGVGGNENEDGSYVDSTLGQDPYGGEESGDEINTTPAAKRRSSGRNRIPTIDAIMRGYLGDRRAAHRRPQRTYVVDADGKVKMVNNAPLAGQRESGPKMAELKDRRKATTPDSDADADASASDTEEEEEEEDDDDLLSDEAKASRLSEEDLLITSPTVLGFSFSDKNWLEFAVSFIEDIEFDSGAFDSLVLPPNQKMIVKALVETHVARNKAAKEAERERERQYAIDKKRKKKNKNSQDTAEDSAPAAAAREYGIDDVIRGKGRGLVAVLHGKPGVGKTLTAEGISELLQRPLYIVGAGELGTDPRILEQSLSKILDMAHTWGAVLLLDEADVFLERRSVHDLHRNALVSVFLRLLEYFQGILFLTTNRVETLDPAFQSRVHVGLHYKDLDRKALRQIWKTFLTKVAEEELATAATAASTSVDPSSAPSTATKQQPRTICTSEEIDILCRKSLNGRMIKNAVVTAQALAASMGEAMGMKHLKLVLDVTEEFDGDMGGAGGGDRVSLYT